MVVTYEDAQSPDAIAGLELMQPTSRSLRRRHQPDTEPALRHPAARVSMRPGERLLAGEYEHHHHLLRRRLHQRADLHRGGRSRSRDSGDQRRVRDVLSRVGNTEVDQGTLADEHSLNEQRVYTRTAGSTDRIPTPTPTLSPAANCRRTARADARRSGNSWTRPGRRCLIPTSSSGYPGGSGAGGGGSGAPGTGSGGGGGGGGVVSRRTMSGFIACSCAPQ